MSEGRTNVTRPWPTPTGPWVLSMHWDQLLFMHWPVRYELLARLIPPGLELERFDGWAWIGVVPFMMHSVRPRLVPSLPWISNFAELNVRTYVTAGGKPGVYFFSLDAANPLAVRTARLTFHLPYYDAAMRCAVEDDRVRYSSIRTHRLAAPANLTCSYRPSAPVVHAKPGSIEAWLTERYCLYSADWNGTVWRGEIDHLRWPLQAAEFQLETQEMITPLRLPLGAEQPITLFSRHLEVVAWPPKRVDARV